MSVRSSHTQTRTLRFRDERPQPERCLGMQEIERLEDVKPGNSILCTNGVLWVTQQDDPEDYLLKPGDKFVAAHAGAVVVQAFNGAACRYLS